MELGIRQSEKKHETLRFGGWEMGYGKWNWELGKVKRKMKPCDFGKIEWDCFGDWEMGKVKASRVRHA